MEQDNNGEDKEDPDRMQLPSSKGNRSRSRSLRRKHHHDIIPKVDVLERTVNDLLTNIENIESLMEKTMTDKLNSALESLSTKITNMIEDTVAEKIPVLLEKLINGSVLTSQSSSSVNSSTTTSTNIKSTDQNTSQPPSEEWTQVKSKAITNQNKRGPITTVQPQPEVATNANFNYELPKAAPIGTSISPDMANKQPEMTATSSSASAATTSSASSTIISAGHLSKAINNVSKKPNFVTYDSQTHRNSYSENRFEVLSMDHDHDADVPSQDPQISDLRKPKRQTQANNTNSPPNAKNTKATPIIAYNINQKVLKNSLASQNKTDFRVLRGNNPDRCVILPESKETHMATLALLSDKKVSHYTFTPKEERNTPLLLKNVPVDYSLDDIVDEFASLGLSDKIFKISPIRSGILAKFNFYIIQILPGVQISEFLKIHWLFHTRVKIEKFTNREDAQCFKCQMMGHFASNCNMDLRCVKCAQEHTSDVCPLPKGAPKEDLKCALCKGSGHPASYRGCPKIKEILKKKRQNPAQASNTRNNANNTNNVKFTSSFVKENISFAAALRPGGNVSQTGRTSMNGINTILNSASEELFGCDYVMLKRHYDTFMSTYKNEANPAVRKEALLNFISFTNYNGQ